MKAGTAAIDVAVIGPASPAVPRHAGSPGATRHDISAFRRARFG